MGKIRARKVLDPTLLWRVLTGRFAERGVSLSDWIHGDIPVYTHLLSGNMIILQTGLWCYCSAVFHCSPGLIVYKCIRFNLVTCM